MQKPVWPNLRATCLATLAQILFTGCPWPAYAIDLSSENLDEMGATSARKSAREIYQRMLDNKYRRGVQEVEVISTDPGGSEQMTVFTASLEDNRDPNNQPTEGINASLLIEVTRPFDMRHTRYLMIAKEPGLDDEFVYQPSTRLVKRVDLKRTPLLGTDYTFDDLAYHDIDGATYVRMADEVLGDVVVFVVEAMVTDTHTVTTHRSIAYIEQDHFVPIKIRYWDEFGVEVKEMIAQADSIRSFGETWIATRSAMRDLAQGTTSRSRLLRLDTDPEFSRLFFSTRRLAQGN
jgi:hypothetical protein